MSLNFLNWLFRISGHSPSSRRSDKYIALVCISLIAMATNVPHNVLTSMRDFGVNSLPQLGSAASLLAINLGSIVNANARTVNFGSLARKIYSDPDVTVLISIAVLYICGCGIRLFSMLMGVENITTSIRRTVLFHFFIIPLLQQILLVRSLKRTFSHLNDQIPKVLIWQSSPATAYPAQFSSFINDYVHLRRTLQDVNSYFSFYSIFFIIFNLLFSINLCLTFLDAIGNLSNERFYEFVANFLFLIPMTLLWLYYSGDCAREANKTVLVVHETLQVDSPLEVMGLAETFSLSLVNNPVALMAGGFVTLDTRLFTKMVGLSLTYFIVVLQLKAP